MLQYILFVPCTESLKPGKMHSVDTISLRALVQVFCQSSLHIPSLFSQMKALGVYSVSDKSTHKKFFLKATEFSDAIVIIVSTKQNCVV